MELQWYGLPSRLRGKIESGIVRNIGLFNHISLTDLLNAFALLGYKWTENPIMREVLFKAFHQAFSNDREEDVDIAGGLARCVFFLGKADLQWNELPEEIQRTILRESLRFSDSLTAFQLKGLLDGYDVLEYFHFIC
jgi:hypothetical protein